jgi:hypothetical protein
VVHLERLLVGLGDAVSDLGVRLEPVLTGPELVDGTAFGCRHQPRGGIVGHAGLWPLRERLDERLLGKVLGPADVAGDAQQRAEQA